jgi:ABC-type antimicrobial peptide transport system permease subunit
VTASIAPKDAPLLIAKTDSGRARVVADALPLQLSPTSPQSYVAQSTADLAELRATVDGSLAGVFAAVAAVLLLVAVLSTSSSLSASVLYRRKEIGLRRALGASRFAITSAFTREGFLLGLLGGLAGAALGVCGLIALSLVQQWPAYLDPMVVGGSVALGALTGTVASFVPALRASTLDPAIALRS